MYCFWRLLVPQPSVVAGYLWNRQEYFYYCSCDKICQFCRLQYWQITQQSHFGFLARFQYRFRSHEICTELSSVYYQYIDDSLTLLFPLLIFQINKFLNMLRYLHLISPASFIQPIYANLYSIWSQSDCFLLFPQLWAQDHVAIYRPVQNSAGRRGLHLGLTAEATKFVMLLLSIYGSSSMMNFQTSKTTRSPQTSERSTSSHRVLVVPTTCSLVSGIDDDMIY